MVFGFVCQVCAMHEREASEALEALIKTVEAAAWARSTGLMRSGRTMSQAHG